MKILLEDSNTYTPENLGQNIMEDVNTIICRLRKIQVWFGKVAKSSIIKSNVAKNICINRQITIGLAIQLIKQQEETIKDLREALSQNS